MSQETKDGNWAPSCKRPNLNSGLMTDEGHFLTGILFLQYSTIFRLYYHSLQNPCDIHIVQPCHSLQSGKYNNTVIK